MCGADTLVRELQLASGCPILPALLREPGGCPPFPRSLRNGWDFDFLSAPTNGKGTASRACAERSRRGGVLTFCPREWKADCDPLNSVIPTGAGDSRVRITCGLEEPAFPSPTTNGKGTAFQPCRNETQI